MMLISFLIYQSTVAEADWVGNADNAVVKIWQYTNSPTIREDRAISHIKRPAP